MAFAESMALPPPTAQVCPLHKRRQSRSHVAQSQKEFFEKQKILARHF
jgi:hypothetical protein